MKAVVLPIVLVLILHASFVAADLFVFPQTIDTGVSNITTAFSITCDVSVAAWTATVTNDSVPGYPPWFVLGTNSGTVSAFSHQSVPVTIYRNNAVVAGTGTGTVSGIITVNGGISPRIITVTAEITAENCGIFPVIASDARGWAGQPYRLSAEGTVGWVQQHFWTTNTDPFLSVSQQAISRQPVDEVAFATPMRRMLYLTTYDSQSRIAEASKEIEIWNSPPWVDAGGPYVCTTGSVVHVCATGGDPNPDEALEYRWQAHPPSGPWTDWSSNPAAVITWSLPSAGLILCEVRDTWPGDQSYNQPLTNADVAYVSVSNGPPTALLQYLSNGVWTSLAMHHGVTLPVLHTNIVLRAVPSDAEMPPMPGPLAVEWREHPANPELGLIPGSARTNTTIVIDDFRNMGLYRFKVVAYDGALASPEADICVRVPGVECHVVVDGFQKAVPAWGVHPTADYPANTNAYGSHDSTQVRTDIAGVLRLDRAINARNRLKLQRDEPRGTRTREYIFTTYGASNFNGHTTLHFPASMYAFAGRMVDGTSLSQPVPDILATLVMRDIRTTVIGDSCGNYCFGSIPLPWPTDNELTNSYYVVFHTPGWTTFTQKLTPQRVQFEPMDDMWCLFPTNATVTLSGTVRSSQSGAPVRHATVYFGALSATNDDSGSFAMQLPVPTVHNPGDPTHVLVVEAPGYTPTQNVYTNTECGGNVTVYIDGGGMHLSGTVYDSEDGFIVTNGTVRSPTNSMARKAVVSSACISPYGYFAMQVPGGIDEIVVEANGKQRVIPIERNRLGARGYETSYDMMPEPVGAWAATAISYSLLVRGIRRSVPTRRRKRVI